MLHHPPPPLPQFHRNSPCQIPPQYSKEALRRPIFLAHGSADPLLPPILAQTSYKTLNDAGEGVVLSVGISLAWERGRVLAGMFERRSQTV